MMAFNCNHMILHQAYIFRKQIFNNTIPMSSFRERMNCQGCRAHGQDRTIYLGI